jgi:hypothetical protein
MLRIPDAQAERAIYLIDTSEVADRLEAALALNPQGRTRTLTLRTFLIGALLSIETLRSFKSTAIHRVLTEGLSLQMQWQLGIRREGVDGDTVVLAKSPIDYLVKTISKRLTFTPAGRDHYKLGIDDEELLRRQTALQDALDRLLDATKVEGGTGWLALDGSNVWAWARAPRRVVDPVDIREKEHVADSGPDDTTSPTGEDAVDFERAPDEVVDAILASEPDLGGTPDPVETPTAAGNNKAGYDHDATIGSMTSKLGGRVPFYGYVMDAAIRIALPDHATVPMVVERLRISPASTDVVAPSLDMLDSLAATGSSITDIVVDRHYSYKRVDRWADELRARGINQHFTLRADEQGFKDVNGMRMTAGWMHCPATPDRLGDIPWPGPGATQADWERFTKLVEERQMYAMDRHERTNQNGRSRWMCPAMAGKVGCPLRDGTVEIARQAGLPIISDPLEAATAPACCTNTSGVVAVRVEELRKHDQPHYWGTDPWKKAYDRRTYVEGLFGSIKNADTEGATRGFTKYRGLPMMSIGLTLVAAAANIRHQRKYYHDRPDAPDHPLLTPDPDDHGWTQLTADEAAVLDRHHRERPAA